jgi:ABC-type antimicrobial peptide transport system permease subunit
MAIGAERGDIGRLIIGRSLVSVGLGLVVGLAVSFALTELVRSLLFGVEPTDPATLAGGAGVIVAAALAAAYIPARRATQIEPVTALRHE